MDNDITFIKRRILSIDTMSLLEDDAQEGVSLEDHVLSEQSFKDLIRSLPTDRDRFMALALYLGFEQVDISFMLSLHPSIITRGIQKMRVKIIASRTKARI